MDDQNTSNSLPNSQPADMQQTGGDQGTQGQTDATPVAQTGQPAPVNQDVSQQTPSAPTQSDTQLQTQPTNQPQQDVDQPTEEANSESFIGDYIENTGGSMVDLLEDVNANDDLIAIVAQEMRLDADKVKAILTPLLDKIHQGQITIEELALIMAAPAVDEPLEEPEEEPQQTAE